MKACLEVLDQTATGYFDLDRVVLWVHVVYILVLKEISSGSLFLELSLPLTALNKNALSKPRFIVNDSPVRIVCWLCKGCGYFLSTNHHHRRTSEIVDVFFI
mmetsp:Transcript_18649/g.27661  ORF Transcript_18649/g.27661 Transcript_18649/m.27661 type:complete len:102 (+) Transcript_18649:3595-3900(+)